MFKAEYQAGFVQGNLQKAQIPAARDNNWDGNYLTDPTHSFPTQLPPPASDLAQAQQVLAQNWSYTLDYIENKATGDVQRNLRRLLYRLVGIYDGATKASPQTPPFDDAWYPQFTDAEMQITYETPVPTFMDLYYLNTTGDLFNFLPPPTPSGSPSATNSGSAKPTSKTTSKCTAFVKVTTRLTKSARETLSVPHVGNARETVINLGHGEWVVDEVACRDHYEVREGLLEGGEEGPGSDS